MPQEWEACLDAWIALAEAHLCLSDPDFVRLSARDPSLPAFLQSYFAEAAMSPDLTSSGTPSKNKILRRDCFLLSHRLLELSSPSESLLHWQFLADLAKTYGRTNSQKVLSEVWKRHANQVASYMNKEKSTLIKDLEAGLRGDLKRVEEHLKLLNPLLHASPECATLFMSGSDFLDALVACYKLMNPPLRKTIISTAYLCVVGLTEGEKPNFSLLVDQLYALKGAAETHKAGPTNVNDSMVAELVTATPLLKHIQHRLESSGSASSRAKSVIAALEGFRKSGGARPKKLIRRKIHKGKAAVTGEEYGHGATGRIHIHQMSLVTQVQDLFPDLGSGFVVNLLDEYHDDVEQVILHLLEDSLPAYLKDEDRTAEW